MIFSEFRKKCADPNSFNRTNFPCKQVFESLLACNSRFLDQAMLKSDPFFVCTHNETARDYRWLMSYYDYLMTYHDATDPKSPSCASMYLSKNRMELVTNTIQYSKNIWIEANCDNCYESSSSKTPKLSTDTNLFLESYRNYSQCVKDASKNNQQLNVTCQLCQQDYLNMNNVYERIKDSFGYYKTCFDIQDQVSLKDFNLKYSVD